MTGAERSRAEDAYRLGRALATGQATAGPDDPLESARGALQHAISLGDPEWSPAASVMLGLVHAERGDRPAAVAAYESAIATGHPEHSPHAWFNLGTLYQSAGDPQRAVDAFDHAVASRHPEYAPKAAVNLGFVAYNDLNDIETARAAFRSALASGHPEQSTLALQNLTAMDQLAREQHSGSGHQVTDDGVDPGRPSTGGQKFRWFSREPR